MARFSYCPNTVISYVGAADETDLVKLGAGESEEIPCLDADKSILPDRINVLTIWH